MACGHDSAGQYPGDEWTAEPEEADRTDTSADPEFIELIRLLKNIQQAGGVGMTIVREKSGEEASIILFHTRHHTPEVAKDVAAAKRLMGLNPEARTFKITYGADAQGDKEIALHTRSGFQVLNELAARASVPPEHVAEHRTVEEKVLGSDTGVYTASHYLDP